MFRPLLSPTDSPKSSPRFFEGLQYPYLVSPKLDGIRGVTSRTGMMSRSWLPLPSYQVQEEFTGILDLDGEIIEGNANDFDVYNRTQSHVMAFDKPGDISYHVFDHTHPDWLEKPYYQRLEEAQRLIAGAEGYHLVEHEEVNSYEELIAYENIQLALGFEGIMLRNPVARYKNGRATYNQNIIYKLKRFEDDEGLLLAVEEGSNNNNTLERDARGYAKRSSAKGGMVASGTAGRLIVQWGDTHLDVAMGNFNHKQRQWIWDNRDDLVDKAILKFRYFAHGMKDLPRFPRALGFRDKIDML